MCAVSTIASEIKRRAQELGFDACGFAQAAPVDAQARERFRYWLDSGSNGCMDWAVRYLDVRDDPRKLLDGARSVIMVAMNYFPLVKQPATSPQIAYYAYGQDYHNVLKGRLWNLAGYIAGLTGCISRPCVDSAPLRERYWAQQAGLGFIGKNHQLIIPGRGSYFFLGGIVTTLELPPDEPCRLSCAGCDACLKACPGGALRPDEPLDARRCLSCLTIELRGEMPKWVEGVIGNRLYGCDACQQCCPHNAQAQPSRTPEFEPSDEVLSLTASRVEEMTPSQFKRVFGHSAVRRTRLEGLRRNLDAIRAADKAKK